MSSDAVERLACGHAIISREDNLTCCQSRSSPPSTRRREREKAIRREESGLAARYALRPYCVIAPKDLTAITLLPSFSYLLLSFLPLLTSPTPTPPNNETVLTLKHFWQRRSVVRPDGPVPIFSNVRVSPSPAPPPKTFLHLMASSHNILLRSAKFLCKMLREPRPWTSSDRATSKSETCHSE